MFVGREDYGYKVLVIIRFCVTPAFLVAHLAYAQSNLPYQVDLNIADLPEDASKIIERSVEGLLRRKKVDTNRSANDLGWDCLAANALLEAGDLRAKDKVQSIAKQMTKIVARSKSNDSPTGWVADIQDKRCEHGEYDAFGDGTCNSRETTYAFQTGLGIACLAKSSIALHDRSLLVVAKSVITRWQGFMMQNIPCRGCVYYATSDNVNDKDRYVRNMNVFMAFAAASIGVATGEDEFYDIANRAILSDIDERQSGNRGYLGKLDPEWIGNPVHEADRIENHSAAIAVLSTAIGRMLGSNKVIDHGLGVWRDWARCDNKACRNLSCSYWAGNAEQCQATHTAAHCAFRLQDPLAASQCRAYLLRTRSVPSFGVWATLLGGSPIIGTFSAP
ncbi:MAG: hypothetical protein PHQ05_13805 [Sterolibacterium sp.]|nr:hypothetical protein [Sterolibacterium sp.]